MFSYVSQASIYLPMTNSCHDVTNTRTLDISGNQRHATWVAGATAPTKLTNHGYYFDGGDYLTISGSNIFTSEVTFAMELAPTYECTITPEKYILSRDYDGSSGWAIAIGDFGSGRYLLSRFGTTLAYSSTGFEKYYKKNSTNILIQSAKSGNSNIYLNGYLILTSATAWTQGTGQYMKIGSNYPGSNPHVGNITRFASYPFALNQMQVYNLQTAWQMKASEV